jgi:hypothetical protein
LSLVFHLFKNFLNILEDHKMRFELSGSLIRPKPLVITFIYNPIITEIFDTAHYIEMGYTHFQVMCIGGGGGQGGGIDTQNTGTLVRNHGGAGGGGGSHLVRGLLSALPTSCDVHVGKGGLAGTDHISDPALTTDGQDGGYSSFNDTTCQASGGKGGKRAQTNSITVSTNADGGDGGVGNSIVAGGGAAGGQAGEDPSPPYPAAAGTPGEDGTWLQGIGEGGGGGAGGIAKYGTLEAIMLATAGGRGSFNPGDVSVFGPGDDPDQEFLGVEATVPGGASGAKASPLNGLPAVYGRSKGTTTRTASDHGIVVVRLTEVVL